MNSATFLLTPDNLPDYLARRGLASKREVFVVRELGGGVSNIVLLVELGDLPGKVRRWVVKQSLEKLRVKDDWRSERERIFREADSIQALRPVLGDSALPEVIHVDPENFLFIMTAAPSGSVVWKEALLEGQVGLPVAREAGRLLARMITTSRADSTFAARFADRTVFDQLRIDPYYRITAARHPDVAPILEELMRDSWRIRTALVHGDYSPKNMLVSGENIFLVDFEVVHWGDPSFDAGFLLNHLLLKALHQPRFAPLYFDAAREFWKALWAKSDQKRWNDFEAMTMRHLGGLMLARIDGKSPVEYIRGEPAKKRVRGVAKRILNERPQQLEEVLGMVLGGTRGAR